MFTLLMFRLGTDPIHRYFQNSFRGPGFPDGGMPLFTLDQIRTWLARAGLTVRAEPRILPRLLAAAWQAAPVNPIVAQVLTIAGVLLGSAATFIATSMTERTRWHRAQSARWDDKRLAAYAEYGNAVKRAVRHCRRVAETKNLLPTGQPIDLDSAFAAIAEAETERTVKWETVLLLGEPATISAARDWHEQVWRLEVILRKDDPDESSFVDAYKQAMRLRNEFYARARADLNVSSGTLPEPTWGSLRL